MMLVCSNHSEVTDGGSCLQAFLTIEQYGLGEGTPVGARRPATKLKNETPSCRLSPVAAAPGCRRGLDPPRLLPVGSHLVSLTIAGAIYFLEQPAGLGPNVELLSVWCSVSMQGRVQNEMNESFSFLPSRPHNKYLLILDSLNVITMCSFSSLISSMCVRQGLLCFPHPWVVPRYRGLVSFSLPLLHITV